MARIKIRGWRWLRDPRGGNPGWKLDQRRLGFAVLSRGWGTAGTSFDGRRVSSDFFHPRSLPLDSRTYTYIYIYRASVDIVAFEQMRTFGVRWRVDMAVGWFQMILDLQGWIKKEGGIHGKVKWISRDSPSFSSPPLPFCFSHFFAHSSLVSLFSKNDALPPDQFYTLDEIKRERGKRRKEKDQPPRKGKEGKENPARRRISMRIVAADDDRSFSVVGYQEGREVEESALTVPFVPWIFPLFRSSRGYAGLMLSLWTKGGR